MKIINKSALLCALLAGLGTQSVRADGPEGNKPSQVVVPVTKDAPRPTPLTRPEMKQMLEDMKLREERIPLPPLKADEPAPADPRMQGYEGRLSANYLPATAGIRGYLNFSGSPQRSANSSAPNRMQQEPDPTVTLDYGFKTRLFWIASRANNCQYCLGHQESKLLAVGMSEDQIAALDTDWSEFPPEEQAAFAFARTLTLQPHLLSDAEIDACRKYYKDLQILEMALSVGGNNAINRWKEGAGIPQSSGGGNFGGSSGGGHSYLTETNDKFKKRPSKVVSVESDLSGVIVPTKMDRLAALTRVRTPDGLAACAKRQARLPVVSDERAREVLGDLAPATGKVPGWMRLLANFPVAGKRQVASLLATERELQLDDLTRAQMAWVIARQNGAWYSLSEAQSRLVALGQTPAQIEQLEAWEFTRARGSLSDKQIAMLTIAKNLAASPVVLTDEQVAEALNQTSPKDVVQAVHYTAMRSLFDRFTEAAALPAD